MFTLSRLNNAKLAAVVSRQVGGKEALSEMYKDVCGHGADSVFSGFIYYSETVEFYRRAKKLIIDALENDASDQGVSVIDLVKSFNCIKGDYSSREIAIALYGRYTSDLDVVYNCLAWYALEKICQEIDWTINE
jgi:hypothetical protein